MMRKLPATLAGLLLFIATLPALAVQPDEVLADPALEARARTLSTELRCMVCQNQSIDDSDAELARDLRVLVRERLTAGDSDRQVLDYVVSRYGEFVLLKPRFNLRNALLWAAPLLVLVFGVAAVFRGVGRRRVAAPVPLSVQEAEALNRILAAPAGDAEAAPDPEGTKTGR